MKKIIACIISVLFVLSVLFLLNYFLVENKITNDIINIMNDEKYQEAIELRRFPVYSQLFSYSCGSATISMVYSHLEEYKPEEELLKELGLEKREKGMLPGVFLKYLRRSLTGYNIILKNNITDTEVLKLIYDQLKKGLPVPVYFSTINAWDKPNYDTHYSVVTGIDMKSDNVVIANAYGFREEVKIRDFLDSLKFKNYKNKPFYLTLSTFLGIIKKNNIYVIEEPTYITIQLKEGFSGEPMKAFADGKEIYSKSPATRDLSWGYLADSFYFHTGMRKPSLEIQLPDKNLKQSFKIDTSKGTLVAVSMKNNKVEFYQPNMFIDLQGDFSSNNVQVLVNGREVYNRWITTGPMSGVAGQVYMKTADQSIDLDIKVKDLGIEKKFKIDLKKGAYIGVRLQIYELTIIQQNTHFMYD